MGKISSGILGGVQNKVGSVIGSSWKGIATIRSMPTSVANPNTVAQQAQRQKFSAVVYVARLLLSDLISVVWNPFAKKMSGYNDFIRRNINCFTGGTLSNPESFQASRGILTAFQGLSVTADSSDHKIYATFTNNSGVGDALPSDWVNMVYYNQTKDTWHVVFETGYRNDAAAECEDYSIAAGDFLHVYCFLSRADMSRVSDSEHHELTVVA
jgi:hypothetical protein